MTARRPSPQELAELKTLNAKLRAENERLYALAELLCRWANSLEARVAELDKELEKIKHRGGPSGLTRKQEEAMMLRYVELDGLKHGMGELALQQVAAEFSKTLGRRISVRLLREVVKKAKRWTVRVPIVHKAKSWTVRVPKVQE